MVAFSVLFRLNFVHDNPHHFSSIFPTDHNNLRGSIPESFSNLVKLTTLTLHENDLTGGTETVCGVLADQLNVFTADCLGRQFPLVEPELSCRCCTTCCSQVLRDCVVGNGLPPENDECSGASPISAGAAAQGSTALATFTLVGECGTAVPISSGLWYRTTGTGQTLRASTCNEDSKHFDTQISIFTGSCNALLCVDGNNDYCGLQSDVVWDSIVGQEYWILVHGGSGKETGSFLLELHIE